MTLRAYTYKPTQTYCCHFGWYPRIFRKDATSGKFLWPGFGENSRVLEWVLARCAANPTVPTKETPIGFVPDVEKGGLNTAGESQGEREGKCVRVCVREREREREGGGLRIRWI